MVFLADSLRLGLAASSCAVRGMRCVSPPRTALEPYVAGLLDAARSWRIDLLIPTCEEVFYIAHRLDRFDGICRVFTDGIDKLEPIHNKWKFSQTPYSRHARAPESHCLSEMAHLDKFRANLTDWVFKPVYSRFAAETKVGPGAADVEAIRPSASRPWIAQRRIVGQEYSTYGVARAGRLLAHVVYRSAYKVGLGSGIYFIACEKPAIEGFVRDFVAREEYTGQIAFDFIEDAGGKPWVLEANPRATSGVHLFAPGDRLVESICGEVSDCVRPSAGAPRMLGLAMAVYGLGQAIRRRALWAFVRDCWRARDVVFEWRDPLPMLLLPLAFGEIVAIALREHRPLTAAATGDIEWNGEPL